MKNDLFRIAPVYDMCSMGFAPKSSDVQPYTFDVSDINTDIGEEQMEAVEKAAFDFWENVAKDNRISSQFKDFFRQGNPVDSLLSGSSFRP